MADEVRVWQVTKDDKLAEIKASKLSKEGRIEGWVTEDISVLEPGKSGLLVIGEQVKTDFDKRIDLLCIDAKGNLVVVELKRDKTPREVTAQALDYASWVKDLGAEEIEKIAAEYFKNGKTLKEMFEQAFGDTDFPDVINGEHSMKIVASEIDDSTERIIRYLSERGININVVRFQMFQTEDGRELLVRTFTVPQEEAEQHATRSSRTKRTSASKTLAKALEDCTNGDEKEFFQARLAAGQEISAGRSALQYGVPEKARAWLVSPKPEYAYVGQKGRFPNDDQFWSGHLSKAEVKYLKNGTQLAFNLYTTGDFDFFQHTMEHDAAGFQWIPAEKDGERSSEDDENE